MFKTLLNKQFLELTRPFIYNRKTGKKRSIGGIIGFCILTLYLIVFLFGTFFFVSNMLFNSLYSLNLSWLCFAIMSIAAITLGVLGSVFNTYSTLYTAKDNDLLLSMPIKPGKILASRLFGIWFLGFIFESVVMLPTMVAYAIVNGFSIGLIFSQLLIIAQLSIIILSLSCILGWIIAKVNSKIKNNSLITVALSLIFFAVYFYFCSNMNNLLQEVIANAVTIGEKIKGSVYPMYLIGQGCLGKVIPLITTSTFSVAVFLIIAYIMSRSFIKLATVKIGVGRKKVARNNLKARSVNHALLSKEFLRFSSSPAYIINCSLGTVFLIIVGVALLFKADTVTEVIYALDLQNSDLLTLLACALICAVSSINDITAPSVSLEGKNIWLIQSYPVNPFNVLKAKLLMHIILTSIPTLILSVCLCVVLNSGFISALLIVVIPQLFVVLTAEFGLFINLLSPNLTWTNETVAVKQSLGVLIAMFSGCTFIVLLGIVCYLLRNYVTLLLFTVLCAVLIIVLSLILAYWLKNKGTKIFETL